MAARKKAGTVPGLSFVLTAEPLIHGKPVENVDPVRVEWNQSFATEWHESHQDLNVRTMLLDLRRRVKAARSFKGGRR